jgi:2-methylfumaryl-CoA isomerase
MSEHERGVLSGLRVIEASAFVAAPLGGMTLAQLGADVIRFEPLEGGIDRGRWPLTDDRESLYWAGLNKGKRSFRVDVQSARGRELVRALVASGGSQGGILLTNLPTRGWLDYEELRSAREDLIMLALSGDGAGQSAVDYTVNASTGFPWVTGPRDHGGPVNHVLPAWDGMAGLHAAVAILAAERQRAQSGKGQLITLTLFDVALAMVGHLGRLAEAEVERRNPPKNGNYPYGGYGHEFRTREGRWVMVVALTERQWRALAEVTGTSAALADLERGTGRRLDSDSSRYEAREEITTILAPWFAEQDLSTVRAAFEGTAVCWGPFQTFQELVTEDPRCSTQNSMLEMVEHPGVGTYLMPGSPLNFVQSARARVRRAPFLGEHTDEILRGVLGLSEGDISRLHAERVVAGVQERPPARRGNRRAA